MSIISANLNNSISKISSIMKSCNMQYIEDICLKIARNPIIIPLDIPIMTAGEQSEIDYTLDCMSKEPLNDKLNLRPKMFAAVQEYSERRTRVKALETIHNNNRRSES